MRDRIFMAYWKGRTAFINAIQSFRKEEKGASDIVAILLVIVILVAVAAVFRKQLMQAVNTAFEALQEALES